MKQSSFVPIVALAVLGFALATKAGNSGSTQPMYPTGSGANIAFGDWVSTNSGAALNTYYSFFVEVPPNQARLTIDIFDPDILQGGAATEEAAGRDRARSGAMTAGYSVRQPNGAVVPTNFSVGNATTPAGSDNAWATLLDYTGPYVRDEFNSIAYTNNDGSANWSGSWTENDDGSPTTGYVQVNANVTTNALQISGPGGAARSATRVANTTALGASPTLTFAYHHQNLETGDLVQLVISTDNFVSTCSTTDFTGLSGSAGPLSFSLALPAGCIATTTSIRFQTSNLDGDNGSNRLDFFYVDDVQIKGTASVPQGHWEVRVDQSSAVTTSNDLNAFAIRAHDGTAGAGGTEYNVYADNMISVGAHPNQNTTYMVYPWVTSGCQCGVNDFDVDSNSTTTASMALTNRTGTFTQNFGNATLSPDNTWNRDLTSTFTTPDSATGYGIWQWDVDVPFYTGNGNYATIYLSSDQAPANPPTSNPVAGSFRTYFPTDAGAAPVKPFLEQLLTFINNGAASNPPTAGQTATYSVTVRIVNPTPHPIVFSSPSNLVTANVPGSGVTYAGSPQVSQGSVTSQPAIGGTGNVVWNPGTVSTGATAILAYRVQAVATGTPMNITGTPASSGTIAQYLDETANSTQSRATYLAGPLCELSIGTLATDAVVSSLEASKEKGRVTVLWTTSSELGAASFDLLRQEKSGWAPVNTDPIPALYSNAAGGTYAVDDPGANGGRQTWAIRETTTDGRTIMHGPFTVTPRPPQAADPKADGAFGTRPNASQQAKPKPQAKPKTTAATLVAETTTRGLHSISASDISAILGIPHPAVLARVGNGGFRLTQGATDVAWTPAGDAILFFADEIDSPYATRKTWQLTEGKGTIMSRLAASPSGPGATSYHETSWFESDNFAATTLPLDPEEDYWFQESFVPGYPGYTTKTLSIDADGLASSTDASLTVRLQGATAASHRAKVLLDGVELASSSWSGLVAHTVSAAIPAALLRPGANSVTIEGVANTGGPLSVFYLDSIGVSYQRLTQPRNGQLELEATGPMTVTGAGASPILLDTTDPVRPVLLTGIAPDATGSLSWNATPGRRYAITRAGASTPATTRASRATDLSGIRAADMLIITASALHDAAETYAQSRRRSGLLVEVVDVEAIFDAVTGGLETPHAIRSYLGQASQWAIAPRYILLAGRGSLDYKGIVGDLPLVPPLMVRTPDGIFASDARLADVDGDGAPDMAIGRIPVSDEGELLAYLAKIERLDASQSRFPALFAADDPDRGVVFGKASDGMQSALPFGSPLRINLGDTPLLTARTRLFSAWASGLSVVNWTGHGGLDRLASEGLIVSSDVTSLVSGTPPVLVALTCIINRFELPNFATLGKQLVLHESGGVAAAWAPTGLASHDASASLGDSFYRALARGDTARIGDLILAATASHPGAGSELYVLLGDPTLEIRSPISSGSTSDGE